MEDTLRLRAAAGHLLSSLGGIVALNVGTRWALTSGDPVKIPATLVILSLLVLTPLAVHRAWSSRGEFIDSHVEATCRFLSSVGLAGVVLIAVPSFIALLVPSGSELLVLPYSAAVALPITWSSFAIRAATRALQGTEQPYPRWAVPESVLSY